MKIKRKLTKRNRKVISAVILAVALSWSAYLIFSPASKNNGSSIRVVKGQENQLPDPTLAYQSSPLENLTLDFANKTFENAVNNNLYQNKGSPSIIPSNSADIQDTISQIIDNEYASEVVTSSDIAVGTDDSKSAQMFYLLYADQVISDIPTFSASSTPTTDLVSTFTTAAQNFDTAVQLLELIKVPPSWVGIHKDLLTLLIHQRNVFESLAKSGDDPLRFMIALYQGGSNQFDSAFSQIQKEIDQKIQDEKLG